MPSIEDPVRLSTSRLWKLTEQFYEQQGAEAWTSNTVPFRITSNPMIAEAYAQVIGGWLRDCVNSSAMLRPDFVVNIVELGAGTGQFSYLLLKALTELVRKLEENATVAKFRYILSDLAERNVDDACNSPYFRPFIDKGILELVVLDVMNPATAVSRITNAPLSSIIQGDPTVLISNYVFDSLPLDAFIVENSTLYEMKIGLDVPSVPDTIVGSYELFEQISFNEQWADMTWPYYEDPYFDDILKEFTAELKNGRFLFPLAPLRCIDAIYRMSGGHLLTLVGDKTFSEVAQFRERRDLGIYHTGTFSSYVNVDAISRWVRHHNGKSMFPEIAHPRFDVFGFVMGNIGLKGETELAYDGHIRHMGPAYQHWLEGGVINSEVYMRPRDWISFLELSRFHPFAIRTTEGLLRTAVSEAEPQERRQFKRILQKAMQNYFPIGENQDPWLSFAHLFQELGEPALALKCYHKAPETQRNTTKTAYDMALCHADLGNTSDAEQFMKLSVEYRQRQSE